MCDFQPGDLVVCVRRKAESILALGGIYSIERVGVSRPGFADAGTASVWLVGIRSQTIGGGWHAICFRKLRPNERTARDEWQRMLTEPAKPILNPARHVEPAGSAV